MFIKYGTLRSSELLAYAAAQPVPQCFGKCPGVQSGSHASPLALPSWSMTTRETVRTLSSAWTARMAGAWSSAGAGASAGLPLATTTGALHIQGTLLLLQASADCWHLAQLQP